MFHGGFVIDSLIPIWGAVTGTVGSFIAAYAVWLNKKSQRTSIVLEDISIKEIEKGNFGTSLDLKLSISNTGLKPTTIKGIYLDFGKSLNEKFKGKNDVIYGLPMNYWLPRDQKNNRKKNIPIKVGVGENSGILTLGYHLMYESNDSNGQHSSVINDLYKSKKFSFIVITSGDKRFNFKAKVLNWRYET